MNPSIVLRALLVLAMLSLASPLRAQTPEIGGSLYIATDGPYTWTFLGGTASPNWYTSAIWSTGPGERTFGNQMAYANNFSAATPSGLYVQGSGQPSTSAISGATVSLLAGTNIMAIANTTVFGPDRAVLAMNRFTTGNPEGKEFFQPPVDPREHLIPTAAVFYGPGNTANVGFLLTDRPMPTSFNDFDLRVAFSNVIGTKLGSGGIGTVPEPSTWMLTLVGLLAAGLMWRRRMR